MSAIFRHIPASSLYVSRATEWLESRYHFSFAEYYNPLRYQFGSLRVLNDDLVQPRSGFGTHPHQDMEIITYVVDGELTHKDSMGAKETLGRGSMQYMSAGDGILHSEMNNGNKSLRFLQLWIKPDKKNYAQNYGSKTFRKEERYNKLHHVVTSYKMFQDLKEDGPDLIPIHQDANIFISELDMGFKEEFILGKKRQMYTICIEGSLGINETHQLEARDAIEVVGDDKESVTLQLEANNKEGAHLLIVEMAKS